MKKDEKQISTEFNVLLQIYEDNINKIPSTFTRLKNVTGLPQRELSRIMDRLYDHRMIDSHWQKIKHQQVLQMYFKENNLVKNEPPTQMWVTCFIVDDCMLPWVKGLYNCTEKVENEQDVVTRFMVGCVDKSDNHQKKLDDFETEDTQQLGLKIK